MEKEKILTKSNIYGIGFCLGNILMLGVFAITSAADWWIQKLILSL